MLWKECIMDKKDLSSEVGVDVLLADILLRLTVLEKLLCSKNIINKEEYSNELEILATETSKAVLKNVEKTKNIEEFLAKLEADAKKNDPQKLS